MAAQASRVERELTRLRQEEARLAGKLRKEEFQRKAPEQVRRQAAERLAETRQRAAGLEAQLADLNRSLGS
jgi:valyl-tRNA synthetase